MLNRHVAIAAMGLGLLIGSTASATFYDDIPVILDGLQEVPPNASPASGSATVDFDDVTGAMSVSGSFANLTGLSNNAHVHGYSAPGVSSPPVFNLTYTPSATSGVFSGAGVTNIANTLAGLTYINIHSSTFPGGEIRGQIVVPEPMSLGTIGLGALALLRRRR